MNYISSLRDRIPVVDRASLLALVVVIVVGLADILFVALYVYPRWQEKGELASQVAADQKKLDAAQRAQASSPDELQKQVEAAQAKLDNVAGVFLSDSQATEARDKLYRYAIENQVEVTDLQALPSSPEEEKDSYEVRQYRLQARGLLRNLVGFVSHIEEAALESFVISKVDITGDEEQRTLSMDVALYASPYSAGAMAPPTPEVTVTPTSVAQLEVRLAEAWALEDWEQAIGLIEQILAIDPGYPDMTEKLYAAHVNYGDQLLEAGDPGGATTQFNIALESKPDGAEAREGLERAVAWTPTPTPVAVPTSTPPGTPAAPELLVQGLDEAWAVASDDNKRAEEWQEVIGLIEQILALSPGDANMIEKLYAAHVNYGRQLVEEGRLEEAKLEFTRALNMKPDGEEAKWGLEALSAGTTPVPSATSTPESQQYAIHVVQPGEWLYQIARVYGTTAQAIMTANGLTSPTIHPGQQLRIPLQ